jgi:hypothetical protein
MVKKKRKMSIKRGVTKYIKTSKGLFRIKVGDSLLFSYRIENWYDLLVGKKNWIGSFVISTPKIKYNEIKYAYLFLTGKTRMVVRRFEIDKFIYQKSEDVFTTSDIPSTKDYYKFSFSKSEPFYKDFGKDIFVDCKYVFDDDIKKLKNLSKYEVIKRLEKYHYLTHKIHKSKKSKVMKIRDKVINLV